MSITSWKPAVKSLTAFLFIACIQVTAFSQDQLFFQATEKGRIQLSEEQRFHQSVWEEDPSILDWFLVQAETSLLLDGSDQVMVPVFDRDVYLEKQHAEMDVLGNFNWSARVLDLKGKELGEGVLVLDPEGGVTGSFRVEDRNYVIKPLGENLHALGWAQSVPFPDDTVLVPEAMRPVLDAARLQEDAELLMQSKLPITVDILVAYTPQAISRRSNLLSIISANITRTNNALTNNALPVRVNLVHTYKTNYSTSGSSNTDLTRFRGTNDGYMDEVHQKRNDYGADICLLYADFADVGGRAYLNASASYAFGVLTSYHSGNLNEYTFAHEVGHIFGCAHNVEDAGSSAFAYGHGFRKTRTSWLIPGFRTVMSYECSSSCSVIPYFSSPNRSFMNTALGDTHTRNNERVIQENGVRVSNFRAAAFIPSAPTISTWYECGNLAFINWTAVSGADSYELYSEFSGYETRIYSGSNTYFRMNVGTNTNVVLKVRACKGNVCGDFSNRIQLRYRSFCQ